MQKDDQGGQQTRFGHYQLPRVSRHDVRIQELSAKAVSISHFHTPDKKLGLF